MNLFKRFLPLIHLQPLLGVSGLIVLGIFTNSFLREGTAKTKVVKTECMCKA